MTAQQLWEKETARHTFKATDVFGKEIWFKSKSDALDYMEGNRCYYNLDHYLDGEVLFRCFSIEENARRYALQMALNV